MINQITTLYLQNLKNTSILLQSADAGGQHSFRQQIREQFETLQEIKDSLTGEGLEIMGEMEMLLGNFRGLVL